MAANVLRSQRAAEMSVFVIRAFIKMREAIAANASILKRLAEIDQALFVQIANRSFPRVHSKVSASFLFCGA